MGRLMIYAKDVADILGRCEKTATNLLAKIRKKYHKTRSQAVSVIEFCEYVGLDVDLVLRNLK
jgi:DNA-binding CsgD family transcriptional regulator